MRTTRDPRRDLRSSNRHWLFGRNGSSRRWRSAALAVLSSGVLLLLSAPTAVAGLSYTFTQVAGSPFTREFGGLPIAPNQVLFSPDGRLLVSTSSNEAWSQTVSKSDAVGTPGPYVGPRLCKEPKGTIIPINTGHLDSVAFSLNGAWLAEVEEPATGLPKGTFEPGTLRIYRVRGRKLISRSCRTLPYPGKNPTPKPYYSVAFGPAGLLAVTNVGKNTVTLYFVSATGKTHKASVFATGKDPDAVAFGPTQSGGEALAVANWGDNNVSMFTDSSGYIAPAAGSPVATVAGPSSVAFSPKGILAVAGSGDNLIYMYSVSLVAGLSGVGAAHTDDQALSVAFSTTGKLLGVANPTDAQVFSVVTSGLLAPVGGSPFSSGGESIAFDHHAFLLAIATGGATVVYSYAPS